MRVIFAAWASARFRTNRQDPGGAGFQLVGFLKLVQAKRQIDGVCRALRLRQHNPGRRPGHDGLKIQIGIFAIQRVNAHPGVVTTFDAFTHQDARGGT